MRRSLGCMLILCLLLGLACTDMPEPTGARLAAGTSNLDRPPDKFRAEELVIELVLRRGGDSPKTLMRITGDGKVHLWKRGMWERGIKHPDEEHNCVVTQADVLGLLIEFYRWDFFSLQNAYSHWPSAFRVDSLGYADLLKGRGQGGFNALSVRMGDYEKTVTHVFCAPEPLEHLEKAVTEFVESSLSLDVEG